MNPPTVRAALRAGNERLQRAGVDGARLDAELLLAHVLGRDRAYLLAYPEQQLDPEQGAAFQSYLDRRAGHEPLAYLTGRRWFYGLELEVTPDALIPRPETELLVEQALRWLSQDRRGLRRVVDVGTGSGAIAVAVASRTSQDVEIVAIDASPQALALARRNAQRCGVPDRIQFLPGDLLEPLTEPADLILANLPYIPSADLAGLMPEVRDYEPAAALDGGPDGLRPIERLLAQAGDHLRADGALFLEIGYDQGERACSLAQRYFPDARLNIHQDLAGLERLLVVQSGRIMDPPSAA